MKLFKKTFSLLAVAALCLGFFFSNSITTSAAEEPIVWYLKYVDANGEWRWQTNTWKDDGYHRELYYMYQDIKDGDVIVIDSAKPITLDLNVRLSNLTVVSADVAVVHAKGYDYVYVLSGATCAINGDVTNADVYGNAVANFNNNVKELRILNENDVNISATVAVVGTVDHFVGAGSVYQIYEGYNFKANSFRVIDGYNYTDPKSFTITPPATPSAPATNNNSNNSNDYDDVPKTGDNGLMNPLWLVAIAAICALGAYKLNK